MSNHKADVSSWRLQIRSGGKEVCRWQHSTRVCPPFSDDQPFSDHFPTTCPTIFRPFSVHFRTIFGPFSDHFPTTFRHFPAIFRPFFDQLQFRQICFFQEHVPSTGQLGDLGRCTLQCCQNAEFHGSFPGLGAHRASV